MIIDFSCLKGVAKKGRLVLTTIACPYCGEQIDLPKSGDLCKCKYCGKDSARVGTEVEIYRAHEL